MASLLTHNDLQNNKKIKSSINGNGQVNNSNNTANGNANNGSSGAHSNGKLGHSQSQSSFLNNGQNSPFNSNKHQQQQLQQQPGQNLFPPGGIPPNLLNLFK